MSKEFEASRGMLVDFQFNWDFSQAVPIRNSITHKLVFDLIQ